MPDINNSDRMIGISHSSVGLSFSAIDSSTDGDRGINSLDMVQFDVLSLCNMPKELLI